MESQELACPLAAETAEQGAAEFGRSGPDARTRKQTGEEKQALLGRSGIGRRRSLEVDPALIDQVRIALTWLAADMEAQLEQHGPKAPLEQYWRVTNVRDARDMVIELGEALAPRGNGGR